MQSFDAKGEHGPTRGGFIAIAACDLAEVLGMAIGLKLLFDLPLLWGVGITMFDTFLLLFLMNKGIKKWRPSS